MELARCLQECSPELFHYHKLSLLPFPRIWQYIQPAPQPHTTCNLPAQHIYIQLPHLLGHPRPATWKAYAKLKKLSESISGGSSVCLWSLFSLYRAHCRQCVFADISVLNGVPHGGSGFTVWAARNTHSKHRCVLVMPVWMQNALTYSEKTLRLSVVPFIRCHHLMLQHDHVQPMLQASVHISRKPKLFQLWHVWHCVCDKMAFKLLWSSRGMQLSILIHQQGYI